MKTTITPTIVQQMRQTTGLLRSSRHGRYIALIALSISLQTIVLLGVSTTSHQIITIGITSLIITLLLEYRFAPTFKLPQLAALLAGLLQAIVQFTTLGSLISQNLALTVTIVAGCAVLACAGVALVEMVRLMHAERWARAFTSLSEAQLAALAARAERVTFRARSVMFRQDAAADCVYLLTRGEVEVLQRDNEGIYAPVAQMGAGAWLGEAGLLGQPTYRTAAKAIGEVEALALDREVLASLLFGGVDVVTLLPTSIGNDLPSRIHLLRTGMQHVTPRHALYLLGSALGERSDTQAQPNERFETPVGSSKASTI